MLLFTGFFSSMESFSLRPHACVRPTVRVVEMVIFIQRNAILPALQMSKSPDSFTVLEKENNSTRLDALENDVNHVKKDVHHVKKDVRQVKKYILKHKTIRKELGKVGKTLNAIHTEQVKMRKELAEKIENGDKATRTELAEKIEKLSGKLEEKIENGDNALSEKMEKLSVKLAEKIENGDKATRTELAEKIENSDNKMEKFSRKSSLQNWLKISISLLSIATTLIVATLRA
jgi:chromosome segregation ATPase